MTEILAPVCSPCWRGKCCTGRCSTRPTPVLHLAAVAPARMVTGLSPRSGADPLESYCRQLCQTRGRGRGALPAGRMAALVPPASNRRQTRPR